MTSSVCNAIERKLSISLSCTLSRDFQNLNLCNRAIQQINIKYKYIYHSVLENFTQITHDYAFALDFDQSKSLDSYINRRYLQPIGLNVFLRSV